MKMFVSHRLKALDCRKNKGQLKMMDGEQKPKKNTGKGTQA